MLFLSRDEKGLIIVDTEDWSKEQVNKATVKRLEGAGLTINDNDCQREILQLLQSHYMLQLEVGGGSTLDLCDEFIGGVIGLSSLQYDLGSSCIDLLRDVKSKFSNLKNKWGTLTTDIFSYNGIYLAFSDTVKSVNEGKQTKADGVYNFCKVYGFDGEIAYNTLWILG